MAIDASPARPGPTRLGGPQLPGGNQQLTLGPQVEHSVGAAHLARTHPTQAGSSHLCVWAFSATLWFLLVSGVSAPWSPFGRQRQSVLALPLLFSSLGSAFGPLGVLSLFLLGLESVSLFFSTEVHRSLRRVRRRAGAG